MKCWTAEEINYLKKNWNALKIDDMDLDRTYKAIYTKARDLGLGYSRIDSKKRHWTENELEYLQNSWGLVSIVTIAKNLNRTKSAVQQKANKLGLGAFLESGDYVTVNQLLKVLRGPGASATYTKKQWVDKGLPVKKRKVLDCSFDVVYLQDFWDWAEINSTIIDFSKMKPLALGKEPDWLTEQRKADKENEYFKKTPWTADEDKQLQELLKHYTYRELSLRLRRTEGAVKRRLIDLNIKDRPIKMPNHNPWTEEETNTLINLYHKGHSRNTFANYINRSSQACSGKIERLIKEGVLYPRSEYRTSC